MEPPAPKMVGLSPHRLEALADGIFAIAMTLLVLDLRIPEATSSGDLATGLAALWPRFATFFISSWCSGSTGSPTIRRSTSSPG